MSTLPEVLQLQNTSNILVAPSRFTRLTPLTTETNPTLNIALENETKSNTVYAYITGLAIDNNFSVFILQADGVTPYYPTSPSSTLSPLGVNCAIPIGSPGSTRRVTIPRIAGGRIWFSINAKLTFLLNPGPGLVEPSVTNPTDPNINITWDFCELTFDTTQVFANITYVDFVALPLSLTLTNTSGGIQHVAGLPSNGLDSISSALQAQAANEYAGWSNLIVKSNGTNVRVLSPNSAISINSSLFSSYYDSYVNTVWDKYRTTPLTIDTQASWGVVTGEVSNESLIFSGVYSWKKPSSADIFNCSSGAFAVTSGEIGNIAARLCAAFNRSTLLLNSIQPDNEIASTFYKTSPTNHYSRIVHATNLDTLGYAFPYDDVSPTGGPSQAGTVSDGSPQLLTVTVGGSGAHTKLRRRNQRRAFEDKDITDFSSWNALTYAKQDQVIEPDSKELLPVYSLVHERRDLEKGPDGLALQHEVDMRSGSRMTIPLPRMVRRFVEMVKAKFRSLPSDSLLCKIITFFQDIMLSLLSISIRQHIWKYLLCCFIVVFYMVFENGQAFSGSRAMGVESTLNTTRSTGLAVTNINMDSIGISNIADSAVGLHVEVGSEEYERLYV